MGFLLITALHNHCRVWEWNNFENRSTFAGYGQESKWVFFFWTQCTSSQRPVTSAKAADPAKFLQLTPSRTGRNSAKNSWIRIVIRFSTKTEWFVASETSNPQKISKNRRQLLKLSAKFIELPLSRTGKNSFQTFLYPHRDPDHRQNLISCC